MIKIVDLEKLGFEEFFKKAPLSFWISETKKNGSHFARYIHILLAKDEFGVPGERFCARLQERRKERGIARIDTRESVGNNYQEAIIKIYIKLFGIKEIVYGELNEENCNLVFERYNK